MFILKRYCSLIKLTIISFCILKNFIIQTTMCFSLLNEESFLKFVYLLDPRYVPPDRKTIRHRMEVEYEISFLKVKEVLKNVSVNLTCDIWTSLLLDPYLGITAHYVDANWIYRSHILDVSLFPHPHDNQSLVVALKEVILGSTTSFNNKISFFIGNEKI
jgi:hypothetical protein